MLVPEKSIQMLKGAHYDETVENLKAQNEALKKELCRAKTAYFQNMAYCAKLTKKLKEHNIHIENKPST